MNDNIVDIIIPTWDNYQYISSCLNSLLHTKSSENLFHVYVVNNGHKESCDWIKYPDITVLQTGGKNLGWEGGLKLGLSMSKAPYVVFFNDDAYIPDSSRMWLNQLIQHFRDDKVGAVGPSSNVVMGFQNIFTQVPFHVFKSTFLIGFCLMVKRSILEEVGGVDDTLPGGDDLDLSIRLRNAGYKLLVDREVFVYHHGFKTGERVHGDSSKKGGWNSYEFKEKTDFALIKKHGFRKWFECVQGSYQLLEQGGEQKYWEDIEGDIIRKYIVGDKILDLGCGGNKTVDNAIGIDLIQKDEFVETLKHGTKSSADINADVSKALPLEANEADTIIARHILEHMIDPIEAVRYWVNALKPGGKLIVAVPLEGLVKSITMNIEHVHAFNKDSMKNLLETCGLTITDQVYAENGVSFITIAQK